MSSLHASTNAKNVSNKKDRQQVNSIANDSTASHTSNSQKQPNNSLINNEGGVVEGTSQNQPDHQQSQQHPLPQNSASLNTVSVQQPKEAKRSKNATKSSNNSHTHHGGQVTQQWTGGASFPSGKIRVDLTSTKYKLLREITLEMKWKVITGKKKEQRDAELAQKQAQNQAISHKQAMLEEKALLEQFKREEASRHQNVDLIWNDVTILPEKFCQLRGFQRVNHFPAMSGVTKKSQLASSLKKMKAQYPIDFGFFPKTWVLPQQLTKLKADLVKEKQRSDNTIMIVKPSEASQGRGIFFINDYEKLREGLGLDHNGQPKNKQGLGSYVVQRYVKNPYLLDGLKFDLRLYVLVTSCQPLTIFWHREGIARFATQKYEISGKGSKEMPNNAHLTNYAVNKDSDNFKISNADIEAGTSSKRTLDTVFKRLQEDGVDVNLLKLKIADLIIKTLISVQPDLLHNYRTYQPNDRTFNMCFEVLGFDVLIDKDTKPWLLEVNQAPSFMTDSDLDYQVKKAVLTDSFKILGISEQNRARNVDRIMRDRELKKMHKQSTLFWNQMRGEEFARELEDRRQYQFENLGGFYKVFPVEDADVKLSGGLFRNSISRKAKSYYNKFERNGNVANLGQTGHQSISSSIRQNKVAPVQGQQHYRFVDPNHNQQQPNNVHELQNKANGQTQQIIDQSQRGMLSLSATQALQSNSSQMMLLQMNNSLGANSMVATQSPSHQRFQALASLHPRNGIIQQQYEEQQKAMQTQPLKQKVFSLPTSAAGKGQIMRHMVGQQAAGTQHGAEHQSILKQLGAAGQTQNGTLQGTNQLSAVKLITEGANTQNENGQNVSDFQAQNMSNFKNHPSRKHQQPLSHHAQQDQSQTSNNQHQQSGNGAAPQQKLYLPNGEVINVKRHTSVEPHIIGTQNQNSGLMNGGQIAPRMSALIPNGTNNGRVYRRQSSEFKHSQPSTSNLHAIPSDQQSKILANQQSQMGQNGGMMAQGDPHSNSWMKRMRQAMNQNALGAAQSAATAPNQGTHLQSQTQLKSTMQTNSGQQNLKSLAQHQVNINKQMMAQHQNGNHQQILGPDSALMDQINAQIAQKSPRILTENVHSGVAIQQDQARLANMIHKQQKTRGASNSNTNMQWQKMQQHQQQNQNSQHQQNQQQHMLTQESQKSYRSSKQQRDASAMSNNTIVGGSTKGGGQQTNNGTKLGKQGGKGNAVAGKQIKAEVFKSYISQATVIQQKILEQSLMNGVVERDRQGSIMSSGRPQSQNQEKSQNFKKAENADYPTSLNKQSPSQMTTKNATLQRDENHQSSQHFAPDMTYIPVPAAAPANQQRGLLPEVINNSSERMPHDNMLTSPQAAASNSSTNPNNQNPNNATHTHTHTKGSTTNNNYQSYHLNKQMVNPNQTTNPNSNTHQTRATIETQKRQIEHFLRSDQNQHPEHHQMKTNSVVSSEEQQIMMGSPAAQNPKQSAQIPKHPIRSSDSSNNQNQMVKVSGNGARQLKDRHQSSQSQPLNFQKDTSTNSRNCQQVGGITDFNRASYTPKKDDFALPDLKQASIGQTAPTQSMSSNNHGSKYLQKDNESGSIANNNQNLNHSDHQQRHKLILVSNQNISARKIDPLMENFAISESQAHNNATTILDHQQQYNMISNGKKVLNSAQHAKKVKNLVQSPHQTSKNIVHQSTLNQASNSEQMQLINGVGGVISAQQQKSSIASKSTTNPSSNLLNAMSSQKGQVVNSSPISTNVMQIQTQSTRSTHMVPVVQTASGAPVGAVAGTIQKIAHPSQLKSGVSNGQNGQNSVGIGGFSAAQQMSHQQTTSQNGNGNGVVGTTQNGGKQNNGSVNQPGTVGSVQQMHAVLPNVHSPVKVKYI